MHKISSKCKLISILLVVFMLISAIPVYASDTYTVTFLIPHADGATSEYVVKVAAGEAIGEENMPSAPVIPGRVFIGWFYRGEEVTAETVPTGDMYVVAAKTEERVTYTVTFLIPYADGTASEYAVEVAAGEAIGEENMPSSPVLPGRVFIGWFYRGEEITADTIPTGDMYIVAARTEEIVTHTVSFYVPDPATGNANVVKIVVTDGNAIGADNIPAIPQIPGKYIIGWYSKDNGVEMAINGATIPHGDLSVYVKYGSYSQIQIETLAPITGIANGTKLVNIPLPETVPVNISGTAYNLKVEWDLESVVYDRNDKKEQTFVVKGKLVDLPDNVRVESEDELAVSVFVTVDAVKVEWDSYLWYVHMLWQMENKEYNVLAEAGEGGEISPVGIVKVKQGDSITYSIIANDGYEIESVKINGNEQGAISSYTFKNVTSDQKISVTFKEAVAPEWKNPFNDVSESDDFYKAVEFVYENDLFKGVSDTEFAPGTTMTRAMFVTVLGRLANVDVSAYTYVYYNDVIGGQYYAPYVAWASENGIVKGYGNGLFGVNDNVTIEQAIVIIARYAALNNITVDSSDIDSDLYADMDSVSSWASAEMLWALESGVYQPSDGILKPQENAPRALVAQMICNFCNTDFLH